jgi:DNA-binding MarR family transcriptional regulator
VALQLTSAGEARVQTLLAQYGKLYRHMLDPLSVEERQQLIAMLAKMTSNDT